jgi:hypothetical protein
MGRSRAREYALGYCLSCTAKDGKFRKIRVDVSNGESATVTAH